MEAANQTKSLSVIILLPSHHIFPKCVYFWQSSDSGFVCLWCVEVAQLKDIKGQRHVVGIQPYKVPEHQKPVVLCICAFFQKCLHAHTPSRISWSTFKKDDFINTWINWGPDTPSPSSEAYINSPRTKVHPTSTGLFSPLVNTWPLKYW